MAAESVVTATLALPNLVDIPELLSSKEPDAATQPRARGICQVVVETSVAATRGYAQ
jgi:hypothetical protein